MKILKLVLTIDKEDGTNDEELTDPLGYVGRKASASINMSKHARLVA